MGLMIHMHAAHYWARGAMTVTTTTAAAASYEQLLYGTATAHMQWLEANELQCWTIADNTMTTTIYVVRYSLSPSHTLISPISSICSIRPLFYS